MLNGFTSTFIDFTKEYESPTSFWKWSAYGTVAALLRNNVYYSHGLGKIYPNIYTILLADSAEFRKDAGPKLASELLREIGNTKVIEGRGSFQAIAEVLAIDIGNKKTGVPLKGGAGIIICPELAAFFVADPQLIPNLTNWYDFKETHDENLKSGKVTIKNRCINILGASNETLLREVYTDRATYGGLLRRTFLIKPDETRKANSLMYMDLTKYDLKTLIDPLNQIKQLKGEVKITPAARKLYDDWYNELYPNYKVYQDRTGFIQAIHSSVLKLAIIIAASNYTMEITPEMMELSISELIGLKSNYDMYAMSSGKSEQADIASIVLTMLWKAPNNIIKRRDILFRYWNEFSSEELDTTTNTLEAAGLIKTALFESEPAYEMLERCKATFRSKISAKTKTP